MSKAAIRICADTSVFFDLVHERGSWACFDHVLCARCGCSVRVGWNCRHTVHFQRIPRYNPAHRLKDCSEIAIHAPLEVAADELRHDSEEWRPAQAEHDNPEG